MNDIMFAGTLFDKEIFEYCLLSFKKAFSKTSVSIENAFKEFEDTKSKIESMRNLKANIYYKLLSREERNEIDDTIYRMVCFIGYQYGMYNIDIHNMSNAEIKKLYIQFFSINKNDEYQLNFDNDILYFIKFNKDGKFDAHETFKNISILFPLEFQLRDGERKAYSMQKDNMDAFDYASNINRNLNIQEIIETNNLVVNSDPNKETGFKKVNNYIIGGKFKTCDKTCVPTEMEKLIYDYEKNFGDGELPNIDETGITTEERNKRIGRYFIREAKFHIRFERIHPFSDGNGRTGRIIMNHNLMQHDLPPAVFTEFDKEKYKKCIAENDYTELADIMLRSSSQTFSFWESIQKTGIKPKNKVLKVSNSSLSTIE